MELIIKRDQAAKKGIFGGHKGMNFTLSCRVKLAPEEKELINKYKVEDYALTYRDVNGTRVPGETIGSLTMGKTYEVSDVTTLLNNEEVIKDACNEFKTLLTVMASFGGEEVIQF